MYTFQGVFLGLTVLHAFLRCVTIIRDQVTDTTNSFWLFLYLVPLNLQATALLLLPYYYASAISRFRTRWRVSQRFLRWAYVSSVVVDFAALCYICFGEERTDFQSALYLCVTGAFLLIAAIALIITSWHLQRRTAYVAIQLPRSWSTMLKLNVLLTIHCACRAVFDIVNAAGKIPDTVAYVAFTDDYWSWPSFIDFLWWMIAEVFPISCLLVIFWRIPEKAPSVDAYVNWGDGRDVEDEARLAGGNGASLARSEEGIGEEGTDLNGSTLSTPLLVPGEEAASEQDKSGSWSFLHALRRSVNSSHSGFPSSWADDEESQGTGLIDGTGMSAGSVTSAPVGSLSSGASFGRRSQLSGKSRRSWLTATDSPAMFLNAVRRTGRERPERDESKRGSQGKPGIGKSASLTSAEATSSRYRRRLLNSEDDEGAGSMDGAALLAKRYSNLVLLQDQIAEATSQMSFAAEEKDNQYEDGN